VFSVATLVGWDCPSLSTHVKVGQRPPLCHPDWSVAQGRDLQFHYRANRTYRGQIALGFRFSIKANCRSLPYATLQSG